MNLPRRTRGLLIAGRVVFVMVLAGLGVYLRHVGLDDADKIASSAGLLVALAALFAPHLLPQYSPSPAPDVVRDTGNASASAGGSANTGLDTLGYLSFVWIRPAGIPSALGASDRWVGPSS